MPAFHFHREGVLPLRKNFLWRGIQLGQIAKTRQIVIFKKSWNWSIVLMPAKVWQGSNMNGTQWPETEIIWICWNLLIQKFVKTLHVNYFVAGSAIWSHRVEWIEVNHQNRHFFRCLLGERKFGESTLLRARSFMDFPTLLKILLILVVITCFGLIIWASSSNKKTQKSIHIDDYQVSFFIVIFVCGVSSSRIQN